MAPLQWSKHLFHIRLSSEQRSKHKLQRFRVCGPEIQSRVLEEDPERRRSLHAQARVQRDVRLLYVKVVRHAPGVQRGRSSVQLRESRGHCLPFTDDFLRQKTVHVTRNYLIGVMGNCCCVPGTFHIKLISSFFSPHSLSP